MATNINPLTDIEDDLLELARAADAVALLERHLRASLAVALVLVIGHVSPALAVQALLPERVVPAVSSAARGGIRLELAEDGRTLRYALDYEALEGEIRGVQLRFGQAEGVGGIFAWLCGTPGHAGPRGTPACPAAPGRLEGELGPDRVVGPVEQGVSPGQFPALLEALSNGLLYVQVESSRFESGELRAQLRLDVPRPEAARPR